MIESTGNTINLKAEKSINVLLDFTFQLTFPPTCNYH